LPCLPRISFERQASKTAALRKKAQLAPEDIWRRLIFGKMIFGKMDENGKSGDAGRPGAVELAR
jgi:hypothetical protein